MRPTPPPRRRIAAPPPTAARRHASSLPWHTVTGLKPLLLLLGLALAGPWLNAAPSLQVTSHVEHPPETGEITIYTVSSPLGEFSFLPPKGWRLQVDAPARQLFLHSPDDTSHLEITFARPNPALAPDASTNALREHILARFPAVEILEEFPAYTSGLTGYGFEIRWNPAPEVTSVARMAFVPRPAGTLEFRLTTLPTQFATIRPIFGALLTSFSERAAGTGPGFSGNSSSNR